MTVDEKLVEVVARALCDQQKMGALDQLWPSDQESIKAQARAAIAAYAAAKGGAPAGWVMVPREPTEAHCGKNYEAGMWSRRNWEAAMEDMLAAAPAAPPAVDLEKVEEALEHAAEHSDFSADREYYRSVLSDIRNLRESGETQKAGNAP